MTSKTPPISEDSAPPRSSNNITKKKKGTRESLAFAASNGSSLPASITDKLNMLTVGAAAVSSASDPPGRASSSTGSTAPIRTSTFGGPLKRESDGVAELKNRGDPNGCGDSEGFEQPAGLGRHTTCQKEESTLMEQMMAEAMAAKDEKATKERKQDREKVKKEFGGGLKKGFLSSAGRDSSTRRKKKPGTTQPSKAKDNIPVIGGRKSSTGWSRGLEFDISSQTDDQSGANGLVLPEVQEAMNETNQPSPFGNSSSGSLTGTDWLTPELLDKISQKPRLAAMLTDPRFAKAMQLMSTSPKEAMALFAANPQARHSFTELTAMLAEHFTSMGKAADANAAAEEADRQKIANGPLAQEALRKAAAAARGRQGVGVADMARDGAPSKDEKAGVEKVLAQPELRDLLMDPTMQRVLQECGEPSSLARYMRHPQYGPKLQLMARAGLVSFQS